MRRLTDSAFKGRLWGKYVGRIISTEPYTHMEAEMGFVCSLGHTFRATPHNVLNKAVKMGCWLCGTAMRAESQRKSWNQLIEDVRAKHGDEIWPVGEYKGHKKNMDWECLNGHKFISSPNAVLNGHGCKYCTGKMVNNHEEYLAALQEKFGGRIWPLEKYRSSRAKILHGCINGHEYMQCPNQVLDSLLGCCSSCSGNKKLSNEAYDKELADIHGGRVIRIGDYIHSNALLEHECGLCGRHWMATRGSVVHQESGCRECAVYGFKMSEPAFVYYLRIIEKLTGTHYFKIGITNRDVEFRVGQMAKAGVDIEKIMIQPFVLGEDAYNVEQKILKEFSANLVQGCTLLKNGNSELFNRDISQHLSCYFTVTP